MKKYVVIGGQYRMVYYGQSDNLECAKRIAREHLEYWDNWQGWHYPAIYRGEGIKVEDGEVSQMSPLALPKYVRNYGDKWQCFSW